MPLLLIVPDQSQAKSTEPWAEDCLDKGCWEYGMHHNSAACWYCEYHCGCSINIYYNKVRSNAHTACDIIWSLLNKSDLSVLVLSSLRRVAHTRSSRSTQHQLFGRDGLVKLFSVALTTYYL